VASNFAAMTVLAAAVTKNKSLDQRSCAIRSVRSSFRRSPARIRSTAHGIQMGYTSFISNGRRQTGHPLPGNVAQGKAKLPFPSWSGR